MEQDATPKGLIEEVFSINIKIFIWILAFFAFTLYLFLFTSTLPVKISRHWFPVFMQFSIFVHNLFK